MTANQRFAKALDWLISEQLVRSKAHFSDNLGWTRNKRNNLERSESAQLLGTDLILLREVYPRLNWEWVATGDGEMLIVYNEQSLPDSGANKVQQIYGVDPEEMNEKEAEILRIITFSSELPIEEREKRLIEACVFHMNKNRKLAEKLANI